MSLITRDYDYRDSIINATEILKTVIRIIDDSHHDSSPDIVEFRRQLYEAYKLTDPLIKRIYKTSRYPISLVE